MDFNVKKKNKKKARKNRIRKEKKWIIPRFVTTILYIVSIFSFCVGIFLISNNDYENENVLLCKGVCNMSENFNSHIACEGTDNDINWVCKVCKDLPNYAGMYLYQREREKNQLKNVKDRSADLILMKYY